MSDRPRLLIDVGSTVIKLCRSPAPGSFGTVERVDRRPGVSPEDQVRGLIAAHGGDAVSVRMCSSANGGLRVGVVGLSRRHSVEAASRAAAAAGANVLYGAPFADLPARPPTVDVLIFTGGVDGADHDALRAALRSFDPAALGYDTLVWAGTGDLAADIAGLAPDRVVANVLDGQLRPGGEELTAALRSLYLGDHIDVRGLGSLPELSDVPVWPTPAVVAAAAEEITRSGGVLVTPLPLVLVDVGGTTTDVHHNAELLDEDSSHPGAEPIVSHVFSALGVAASRRALLTRLAGHPVLYDFLEAAEPDRGRELYGAFATGHPGALDGPLAFLGCLFLSLAQLGRPRRVNRLDLARAASLVVTGGAWHDADRGQMRRVLDLASGHTTSACRILVDEANELWMHGLDALERRTGVAA